MACLRHGYWLHREGASDRLNPAILPAIARAQRRLQRATRRSSTNTAARAYGIARTSLCDLSRPTTSPAWRHEMFERPYWAERAVPTLDKQHKLFYQHILTVLGLDDERISRTLSMRHFGSLADDIHDQAKWSRLLTDEGFGAPYPVGVGPRRIPYVDITDDVA
jgi:hypothetical protein